MVIPILTPNSFLLASPIMREVYIAQIALSMHFNQILQIFQIILKTQTAESTQAV